MPGGGTHSITFLSSILKYSIFITASTVLILSHFKPFQFTKFQHTSFFEKKNTLWACISLTAIFMGILFYQFPIYLDVYGDAVRIMKAFGNRIDHIPQTFIDHLFSFNILHPRNGERSVLGSVLFFAYKTGLTLRECFRILGAICGAVYIFLWLAFVMRFVKYNLLRVVFALTGLTAPFLLLFQGHVEIYAPSIVAITAYLLVICNYFRTRKNIWLWFAPVILYFCLKFHSSAFLLMPSLLLTFLFAMYHDRIWMKDKCNWRGMTTWIMTPIFLAGAFVYFFVHGDYNDPRHFFTNFTIYDRMFLPILSPAPPLDRYNLLSLNHIFDYFNIMLLWSPIALFLLISLIFYRKQINWNAPIVLISGLTLILYAALLFMINPLLGMQFDWDLFSLPAPILLIFIAALFSQFRNLDGININHADPTTILPRPLKETNFVHTLIGPSLALSLLTLPIFITNTSKKPLSYRLESLGVRTFETYWIRAAAGINFGIDLLREDKELYISRRLNVAQKLEKYATPGNDVEYADILIRIGKYYLREPKAYQQALQYFERVDHYFPNYPLNLVYLIETHFLLQQFEKAYMLSLRFIRFAPDQNGALRIAIHCALEAEKYTKAMVHCEAYLKQWPQDQLINNVYQELQTGDNTQNIKRYFASAQEVPQ